MRREKWGDHPQDGLLLVVRLWGRESGRGERVTWSARKLDAWLLYGRNIIISSFWHVSFGSSKTIMVTGIWQSSQTFPCHYYCNGEREGIRETSKSPSMQVTSLKSVSSCYTRDLWDCIYHRLLHLCSNITQCQSSEYYFLNFYIQFVL